MSKVSQPIRYMGLALASFGMIGCYTQRMSNDDNAKKLNGYLNSMHAPSHVRFMQKDVAEQNIEKNAATISLSRKDTTKNIRLDKRGVCTALRQAKLLYDETRGMTFQVLVLGIRVDEKKYGFRRTAPILFIDQSQDNKDTSVFDMRFHQVNKNAICKADKNDSFIQKENFYLNKDGTVTEKVTFSKELGIHYEFIYDLNKKMIFGQCPGNPLVQPICSFDEANAANKKLFLYAQNLAQDDKIATVSPDHKL